MRIAVAGGTGTVGRHVVDAARLHGHNVVILARSEGVDVLASTGIDHALQDADAVIDVLNTTTLSTKKARAFFRTATKNLLDAEWRVGVPHHVALSIVGIDGIDTAYYAGKLAQERLVTDSRVPHTIARTTQFHEFAEQIAAQTTFGPFTLVPRTRTRPVAAEDVGEHLVAVAEGGAIGRAVDLVGPADTTLASMVRRLYARRRISKRIIDFRFPGAYGRGLASGALRGDGHEHITATTTFDAWLEAIEKQARA